MYPAATRDDTPSTAQSLILSLSENLSSTFSFIPEILNARASTTKASSLVMLLSG